jgi:hypothetical protein
MANVAKPPSGSACMPLVGLRPSCGAPIVTYGDAQKQLSQNRRPPRPSRIRSGDAQTVASMMRAFRACRFPSIGSWAARRAD